MNALDNYACKIEYLDRGSAAVTEHEAGTIERILTNDILHHHRQTVDLFAHVGGTGLNENGPIRMRGLGENHPAASRTIRSTLSR